MKKIILIFIFLNLFFPPHASAYNFEDYQWGASIEKLEGQLRQKEKKVFKENSNALLYYDKIFNETCEVRLYFTPTTKLLGIVEIKWETDVFSAVSTILEKKYGKPYVPDYEQEFFWGDTDSKIILKPSLAGASLEYTSLTYKRIGEKENNEINSKETDRF